MNYQWLLDGGKTLEHSSASAENPKLAAGFGHRIELAFARL
jgi:hypothetical protein